MSDWLSSLTSTAQLMAESSLNQAKSLADQAKSLADGLADTLVATATAAQEELDIERNKLLAESGKGGRNGATENFTDQLPWDSEDESKSIISESLMQQILNLSLSERNFTERPLLLHRLLDEFCLEEVAPVIMQLMEIDTNLVSMHAKVSPNMNEEDFWKNYFVRIRYLRKVSGIEGSEIMSEFASIPRESVIHRFTESASSLSSSSHNLVEGASVPITVSTASDAHDGDAEVAQRRKADLILKKEVEAELVGDDIDFELENLDLGEEYLDLDLDDLDADLLNDEEDAALEAQIAKELELSEEEE